LRDAGDVDGVARAPPGPPPTTHRPYARAWGWAAGSERRERSLLSSASPSARTRRRGASPLSLRTTNALHASSIVWYAADDDDDDEEEEEEVVAADSEAEEVDGGDGGGGRRTSLKSPISRSRSAAPSRAPCTSASSYRCPAKASRRTPPGNPRRPESTGGDP